MLEHLTESNNSAVVVTAIAEPRFQDWLGTQPAGLRQWIESTGFDAAAGAICLIAGPRGRLKRVLFGLGDDSDPWVWAHLPAKLPPGPYRLEEPLATPAATWAALAWMLASYGFDRYRREGRRDRPDLAWPEAADRAAVERAAAATKLVRDLINTPASDMGPAELAEVAEAVARHHGATCRVVVGDDLLASNWPAVHAVGRASDRVPRLIDLTWGEESAPKVTVVGKGVCFDTGGLDLKPGSAMKLMKKDMGGAAHAIGLAKMVMMAELPVRLRVLVPAVENAVSGRAMRPLDVIRTRKGLTVEIGNTDAEGRLILADALAAAEAESPEMIVDLATLTGAARSALGTDLPALFCNDEALAAAILRHGEAESDPLWRLPLWKPYRAMLDSKVADINNVSDGPYAGAITAALFLREFVGPATPWAHIDLMAWNTSARPGRPEGGEAMALRALFAMLAERYRR